jgi:hypothetical protein
LRTELIAYFLEIANQQTPSSYSGTLTSTPVRSYVAQKILKNLTLQLRIFMAYLFYK